MIVISTTKNLIIIKESSTIMRRGSSFFYNKKNNEEMGFYLLCLLLINKGQTANYQKYTIQAEEHQDKLSRIVGIFEKEIKLYCIYNYSNFESGNQNPPVIHC